MNLLQESVESMKDEVWINFDRVVAIRGNENYTKIYYSVDEFFTFDVNISDVISKLVYSNMRGNYAKIPERSNK